MYIIYVYNFVICNRNLWLKNKIYRVIICNIYYYFYVLFYFINFLL